MISQPGYQLIIIHILSNISRSKGNWNLVSQENITREIFFFNFHAENEAEKLVPKDNLFFKKSFIWDKDKWPEA